MKWGYEFCGYFTISVGWKKDLTCCRRYFRNNAASRHFILWESAIKKKLKIKKLSPNPSLIAIALYLSYPSLFLLKWISSKLVLTIFLSICYLGFCLFAFLDSFSEATWLFITQKRLVDFISFRCCSSLGIITHFVLVRLID